MGLFFIALLLFSGCSLNRPVLQERIRGLGHFEFREPAEGLEGVVIGAPHGQSDRDSDRIARAVSDRTGTGLVVAYGFKAKRLSVTQPIVRSGPYPVFFSDPLRRGSVFAEYQRVLRAAAKGDLDLYIGIHRSNNKELAHLIEVSTSGLTFAEAEVLKRSYAEVRDQLIEGHPAPRLVMKIEPLDRISWRKPGVKHHGVLLVAEKGLNLRLPHFSSEATEELYTEVFSRWIDRVLRLLRENPLRLPQIQVRLMDLGRFELIRSRMGFRGVVVGAPHGSYDEHTAEVVKRISHRTGIAAVIVKGFTPTEAGGWRINVNRPTEKIPYSEDFELHSQRAREVYRAFRDLVFRASGGGLNLYIDIHQYNTDDKIQVATVGVSRRQARIIKMLYQKIRDRTLVERSGVQAVDLVIEPLDDVEIGAWAAKAEGVLRLAKKSLHIELPGHRVLVTGAARESYIHILSSLIEEAAAFLLRQGEAL